MFCSTFAVYTNHTNILFKNLKYGLKNRVSQQKSAEATAKANEVLSNFKTVRSFANEDYELDEYSKLVNQSCSMNQV